MESRNTLFCFVHPLQSTFALFTHNSNAWKPNKLSQFLQEMPNDLIPPREGLLPVTGTLIRSLTSGVEPLHVSAAVNPPFFFLIQIILNFNLFPLLDQYRQTT